MIHPQAGGGLERCHVTAGHLVLTITSDRPLDSPRVFTSEQTSAKRFHHEVRLATVTDLDVELRGWLRAADDLSEERQFSMGLKQ